MKKSADSKSMKNYSACKELNELRTYHLKFSSFRFNDTNGTGHTVKPVLRGHSKIDKTKVLKTNGSLMKVESIAECSLGAFCITFDLH